jgi:hypothetical protein
VPLLFARQLPARQLSAAYHLALAVCTSCSCRLHTTSLQMNFGPCCLHISCLLTRSCPCSLLSHTGRGSRAASHHHQPAGATHNRRTYRHRPTTCTNCLTCAGVSCLRGVCPHPSLWCGTAPLLLLIGACDHYPDRSITASAYTVCGTCSCLQPLTMVCGTTPCSNHGNNYCRYMQQPAVLAPVASQETNC